MVFGIVYVNVYIVMEVNLEHINRRHILQIEGDYRREHDLYSRLVTFRNGVIYLEVMFGPKWRKNYRSTAFEIAHFWKENHPEIGTALGAKVYIVDARKHLHKRNAYFNGEYIEHDGKKGVMFTPYFVN